MSCRKSRELMHLASSAAVELDCRRLGRAARQGSVRDLAIWLAESILGPADEPVDCFGLRHPSAFCNLVELLKRLPRAEPDSRRWRTITDVAPMVQRFIARVRNAAISGEFGGHEERMRDECVALSRWASGQQW